MSERPRHYIEAALVSGAPAWMLRRLFPLAEVERRLDDGGICNPLRAEIVDTWRAVEAAARAFEAAARAFEASACESVTMRPTEAALESTPDELLTSEQVADEMHLTESRIRQLARQGDLPGRQIAGRWWVFARRDVNYYQKGPR